MSCNVCEAMTRVFGDRFSNCSVISDELIRIAIKGMIEQVAELQDEIDAKKMAGTITKEDHELLTHVFERAFSFAAGSVPAAALATGVDTGPVQMLRLVEDTVQIWVNKKLDDLGPEDLIKALESFVSEGSGPDPTDSSVN